MDNKWVRLLAYVTGLVNQELLLQNEYLTAENRILKAHLQAGFRLTDGEGTTLAEIGKPLGRKTLQKVVGIVKPDTLFAWYRRVFALKLDGTKQRLVGAMANLGHQLTDQTVGNILRRHGIPPAPKRSQTTTWREFIRRHMDILSGADFFTVEVLTWRGLVTYYVLFFIHLDSR